MLHTTAEPCETVVETLNPEGRGPVVILCEHASNFIPERYHGLGLTAEARISHAAWDPGALAMSKILSKALDAPLVTSTVSRLVYDSNRPPEADSAMPSKSELIDVPGNVNLSAEARAERTQTVYVPFCAEVDAVLARRVAQDIPTAVITMHTFTPIYHGAMRDVEIGVLHDDDSAFADAMLYQAPSLGERVVRRNEPYGPADGVTHSLKLHGQSRGLPNVMIEVRNDLATNPEDEAKMAQELLTLIGPALVHLGLIQLGRSHT
ncbi:N-formylglutamate amidohydrolase [Cochlodiniinecator piscidefendens]|uniref:N-formylglutamate amidohydrolase n=1 Tax=Cochlodiniinecator piscidefendens TaxID=2715756 RepID=UPI00140E6799|nr:N-formylglutamate amidohydrolase [Cochlodiniinecator piscidefendens]